MLFRSRVNTGFAQIGKYYIDGLTLWDFAGKYLSPKKDETLYEIATEKHQVVLLDNIYLPVYYGKIDRKEYYIKYFTYTDEEMQSKLSENFEKFILGLQEKGVQIVEKDVKMERNSIGMELNGSLLVVKQTGETVEIPGNTIQEDETKE